MPAPRPTEPLPFKPAGYLLLESYSSLRRFWSLLDFAERAGRRVVLQRNDQESTCRRRIEGFALTGAGAFLNVDRALSEVQEDAPGGLELLALTGGDPRPLQSLLSERYELRATFTLALTKGRDLILKPDFAYKPLGEDVLGVKLLPRPFSRDELRFLLNKACGLG